MTQAILQPEKSTTVRSIRKAAGVPAALRWTRRQLAVRTAIASFLGESFALKLFFTPRRFPFTDAEFALLAAARPFRVGRLAAWKWGEGPVVLLMHGWEGRGAQLAAFVEPLVARGFSVVTFDAPAHGVSPGDRATIPAFAEAALAVARRVGQVHAVVAHSLGTLGALLAQRRGLSAKAFVLIGTPSPGAAFSSFQRLMEMPEAVVPRLRARIVEMVGISFEDIEGAALARGLDVAMLLVHDRGDKEAAHANSEAIVTAVPSASLILTDGLGHRRILGDAGVVSRSVEFVAATRQQ